MPLVNPVSDRYGRHGCYRGDMIRRFVLPFDAAQNKATRLRPRFLLRLSQLARHARTRVIGVYLWFIGRVNISDDRKYFPVCRPVVS